MIQKQNSRPSKQHAPETGICFEPLEPRLLLSGSWGTGVEAPGADSHANFDGSFTQETSIGYAGVNLSRAETPFRNAPGEPGIVDLLDRAADLRPFESAKTVNTAQWHELVLVNGDLAGREQLIADLQGDNPDRIFEIIILDANGDGIDQVTDLLAHRTGLAAVHVITHGSDGQINLGNSLLNSTTLQQSGDAVASWGSAMSDAGDILFYGCNIAGSEAGQRLIDDLSDLTLADVAASDDLTGHASLGGDWELEYTRGSIESTTLVNGPLSSAYQHTLATYTVDSLADSGGGSLRQAITDANTNGGADAIAFNVTGTINLASALPDINSQVAIDGGTAPGYTGEPLVILDGSSTGGSNGLTFAAGADGSSVHGLAIVDFSGNGIQVDSGADGIRITGNWIGTTGNGSIGVGNTNNGINVQGADTIIGGTGPNEGNVITNNGNEGINLTGTGATGTIIQGNIIGLDPDGDGGSGNGDVGIAILQDAHDTIIGGTTEDARNIISNNYEGIEINSNNNIVQGNYVGTDLLGTQNRGNHSDDGIEIQDNATGNLIGGAADGAGNLIAFNALDGVNIVSGSSNAVLGNQIHSNGDLSIDLGGTANGAQTAPALASAATTGSLIDISGSLNSTPNGFFRIEFFANPSSGGQTYLGYANVATDGTGNAAINATLNATVADGAWISATATRSEATYTTFTDSSELGTSVAAVTANTLWISADEDSASGADGLASWREGEVLQFGGPSLTLGSTTDGDFSSAIDFDLFLDPGYSATCDPGALHYVTRDLTVGSGADQFNLQIGDVLVSFNQDETILGTHFETGSNALVQMNDLLVFRPDTPGIFTAGTFHMLLNGVPYPGGGAISNLNAISLVEQDTYVGNTLLPEGSFLFSEQSGSGVNTPNHIYHFTPTVAGQNPADGTSRILIDGDDIGIEAITTSYIRGLDLIEKPTAIGGLLLDSGDILVTLNQNDGAVGDPPTPLSTATSDIFVLKVTEAEPEAGNSDATAEMVFNGSQVNFNEINGERVYAISLFPDNYGPAVAGDTSGAVTEDVDVVVGTISDAGTLTVADPDAGESFFVAETLAGTYGSLSIDAAGAWSYTADNSQAAIQALNTGDHLDEFFLVATADGTTQRVTITIDGADEPLGTAPIATPDPGDYSASVLALTPLSYWRLGESGGAAADLGSSANDGAYIGGLLEQTGAINGDGDTAARFVRVDASNGDYVAINHSDDYLLDNGTVQLWFNVDTAANGDQQQLFSKDSQGFDTGGHISIYLDATGDLEVRLQSTTADYFLSSPSAVTEGVWHHVAVSFGAGGMVLYLDGQEVDTNVYTGGLGTSSGGTGNREPIAIGGGTQNSGDQAIGPVNEFFTGWIDEVAIIDSQIGAATIQDLYAAGRQYYTVDEDSTLNVAASEGVLINDFDAEGDPLTVAAINGSGAVVGTPVILASGALVTLDADGSFTYDPNGQFEYLDQGQTAIDTFTYVANDGSDDSTPATVTITITGVNVAPVAVADSFTVAEGSTTNLNLAGNDSDADDGLDLDSIVIVSGPSQGTIVVNTDGTGTVDYTHNGSETAFDSFTYTIADVTGAVSNTVTVSLTISAQNDAPIARPDGVHLSFDGNDFIHIADDPSLQMTNTVTMEAWINHSGGGSGSQLIVNKEGEYEMGVNADTREIIYAIADASSNWAWHNTGHVITPGEWTHVAVTFDGFVGEINTYVNGALVDTYAQPGPMGDVYTMYDDLYIGGRENDTNQRFQGQIDEVRVWNTTRTPLEIQSNMNGLLTGIHPGLAGYWRLDEAGTGSVVDLSGNDNTGTLGGLEGPSATPTYQGYYTDEETPLTIPAISGVLANDSDAEGDPLTVVEINGSGADVGTPVILVSGAQVTLNADGSFTYDPNGRFEYLGQGQTAIDTFTYVASDGSDDSNTAAVTITITGVNDAPVAVDDTVTATEDTVFTSTIDLDANDTDVDGDGLTVVAGTYTTAAGGTLVLAADGSYTYTPAANFNGIDTVDYTVTDGTATDTGTLTITVAAVNDAPVAVDDTVTATEDTVFTSTIDLDANDTDVDGDGLTVVAGTYTTAAGGTLVLAADGSYTYTPAANFNGIDTVDYTVTDGTLTDTGTLTITVAAVNDAPVAVDDTVTATEDTVFTSTIDLDANDTDVDGDGLTVVAGTYTTAAGGTLVLAADGSYTYTPAANFNGIDTVDYTVTDGTATDTGTLTITVAAVNDAPVAVDDTVTATEDTVFTSTIDLDANDTDVDGDGLTVVAGTYTTAAGGTLVLAADGSYTYTPAANFNGIDTVDYTVTDGTATDTGTLTITVAAVNDAPVAVDDTVTATEDTVFTSTIDLDANDTDVDGDGLTVVAGTYTTAAGGTLVLAADGSYTYTPAANFNGIDTVDYTVTDGTATDTGTLTITVAAVNDAPVAVDDTVTATEDTVFTSTIDLDANDTDVDGDGLTVVAGTYTTAAGGTLVLAADGSYTYTPAANFNGIDTVDYTVTDGTLTDTGTLTITVAAVNDAPVATDDAVAATEDTVFTSVIDLEANDTDIDGDALTVVAGTYTTAQGGTLVLAADGSYTYTPASNFTGTDTVNYTVTDGSLTDTGTLTITVAAVNDAPTIGGVNTGTVSEDIDPDTDGLIEAAGLLTIADPDMGESHFQAGTVAGIYGTLTIDASGNWDYAADNSQTALQQLDAGESVSDVMTVATADGTTHDVTITINGSEDSPTIAGAFTGTVTKDAVLTTSGALSITDPDNSDNPITFTPVVDRLGDNGHGSFALSGGVWTYSLDSASAAVQAMDVGDTLTDTITFSADDGSTCVVTVTINGHISMINGGAPGPDDRDYPDPNPDDDGAPGEPEAEPEPPPEDILPVEEDTPPPEPVELPPPRPVKDPGIAPVQGFSPGHFVPTISADSPNVATSGDSGTQTELASAVKYLKRELATRVRASVAYLADAAFSSEAVFRELDNIQQQIDDALAQDGQRGQVIIGAATGLGVSVFAGYVIWAFRGASLLLGALTAMPMWRCFDPLPVLLGKDKEEQKDKDAKETRQAKEEESRLRDLLGEEDATDLSSAPHGGKD